MTFWSGGAVLIKLHWWGCSFAVYMEQPPLIIIVPLHGRIFDYSAECVLDNRTIVEDGIIIGPTQKCQDLKCQNGKLMTTRVFGTGLCIYLSKEKYNESPNLSRTYVALRTVPEQKVVISNFLKLKVYGNCDACMHNVNTIYSNLHAYVDLAYFLSGIYLIYVSSITSDLCI